VKYPDEFTRTQSFQQSYWTISYEVIKATSINQYWQAHSFLGWREQGFQDQEDIPLNVTRHPQQA